MCFSASISFATSLGLIPLGLYVIRTALTRNPAYVPMACVPLGFGLQQGAEGLVWTGLAAHQADLVQGAALAFLFFSHWFWLVWVPWSVLRLETQPAIRRVCRLFLWVGVAYGAALYLPLLLQDGWLSVAVVHASIDYQGTFVGGNIPVVFERLLYALILLPPLLLSSNPVVSRFGVLVTGAALITYLAYSYAFVSVWCFFAALLSVYIVQMMVKTEPLPTAPL